MIQNNFYELIPLGKQMLHRLAKLVKIRNITKLKKFNKPTKPVNAIALHINKSKKDPTDIAVNRT